VDLTHIGWRIAGTMPVQAGMQLALELAVPGKSQPLRVERATVLWVNGCEFAIEAHEMEREDQLWVDGFLRQNLGLPWMSSAAGVPSNDTDMEPYSPPARDADSATVAGETISQSWITMQPLMNEIEEQVIQRCMTDTGCLEKDARAAYDRFIREVWQPALRIVGGMVAKQASGQRGRDSISNN